MIRAQYTTYLEDTLEHVYTETAETKPFALPPIPIQFRNSHENIGIGIFVEQTKSDDWQESPEYVPEEQVGVLKDTVKGWWLVKSLGRIGDIIQYILSSTPTTVNLEPEQYTNVDNVFVKEIPVREIL